MTINNKVYDLLKYLAQIGLPALATFVFTLGPIWDMPRTEDVSQTIVAINVLLGALLVLNQIKYNNSDEKYDGTIDPYPANNATDDSVLSLRHSRGYIPAFPKKEVLLKVQQKEL